MGTPFAELVTRAEEDPAVLGLVLSGSVARDLATERSDTDVYVIVAQYGGQWTETTRSPELDTAVVTLDELADVSDRWQRYAFRGARVLIDRLDGRIAELVNAQATLTPGQARTMAAAELDGYLNFVYRAGKNRRDGRADLARLEEIEAVPWFMWTLFALYGRVRPYNKYLRWELETHPLPAPWTADYLIDNLTERPSRLLGDLDVVARARGFGDILDSWDLTGL